MSDILKIATEWYIRLHDPAVTEQDRQELQRWLEASSQHRDAWHAIEQVDMSFSGLNPELGQAVLLKHAQRASRRQVLKKLGIVALISGTGALMYREQPWQGMLADYTTGKGEQRSWTMPDDTIVVLNTGTAIDTIYNDTQRIVVLIKGEIMVQTGHPAGISAPFQVKTRHGMITAMGTRFSVRDHGSHISVNVFEHAVSLAPAHGGEELIQANQTARFDADHVTDIKPLPLGADLWVKGILSANDMSLQDFLTELGRYHSGVLRCDPAIADLKVSGAFPVNDLDAILSSLQDTYRLRLEFFTRYWVTLRPA